MRPARLAAALLAALASTAASADAPNAPEPLPGYDRLTVAAAHRPGPLAASIWHPAGSRTYRGLVGDNPVFHGTPALIGAAVAEGRFPLVLLSHGSGGNMDGLGWLASALARRGAMVLGVNHPGTTSGDSSPRRTVRLDERAADLSVALDALLADPSFGPHVDRDRIAALGFSLGGATALNLAGARLDRAAYRAYCDRHGERAADCVFLAKGGVDLSALPEGFEGGRRDPRIGRIVAVDPGFTYAMTGASAAAIDPPVLFIALGEEARMLAGDVSDEGSGLARRLHDARLEVVAPAHHFTFLGLCKPGAAAMLEAEGDDPICEDPEGADRAGVHAEIADLVADFLGLPPEPPSLQPR